MTFTFDEWTDVHSMSHAAARDENGSALPDTIMTIHLTHPEVDDVLVLEFTDRAADQFAAVLTEGARVCRARSELRGGQ